MPPNAGKHSLRKSMLIIPEKPLINVSLIFDRRVCVIVRLAYLHLELKIISANKILIVPWCTDITVNYFNVQRRTIGNVEIDTERRIRIMQFVNDRDELDKSRRGESRGKRRWAKSKEIWKFDKRPIRRNNARIYALRVSYWTHWCMYTDWCMSVYNSGTHTDFMIRDTARMFDGVRGSRFIFVANQLRL